jgi:glycosyltransferase involved in cell wall biosynthesis
MNRATPNRILFLCHEFTAGGAAYLALRHIKHLTARYEIDLLVTGPFHEAMTQQLPEQVSFYSFDLSLQELDLAPRKRADFLLKLHLKSPPFQRTYHSILATSIFPSVRACLVFTLLQARRKMVFLVDEGLSWYSQEAQPSEKPIIENALRSANLVIPVSKRLWERMRGFCPVLEERPWQVLRPPVDTEKILHQCELPSPFQEPRDRPIMLTVARLSHDKQILKSLQIHHRLRQAGIEFLWYIVGQGPEEKRLREEIDRLSMADVFFLVGNQDNVYAWMKHCDLFALLSLAEGCPTVVIEALLTGSPVIMTEVSGADELLKNGCTGVIVPHDEDTILEAISRVILDADLIKQFRQNISQAPPISDTNKEHSLLLELIETSSTIERIKPKVSILIAAYNHEACINRAIASALMMNYPSLEVVVSDDASLDETESRARTWANHSTFRYERNLHNLGRVANYHKALTEHARGEWVLMLDGDDYLIDPGYIHLAMSALERHADQSPVFAQAGHQVHYVHDESLDGDVLPAIKGKEKLLKQGNYLKFVFETGFFTHMGILYNRKAAIKNGSYTLDISSSDMDSFLRLAQEGKVLVLKTLAGRWVQHGTNTSSNLPLNKILENVRIFRQIAEKAARRKLLKMSDIDESLTRYEALTLAHLIGQTVGKSLRGPLDVLRMLYIVMSINPRLLSRKYEPSWDIKKLTMKVLGSWLSNLPIVGKFNK